MTPDATSDNRQDIYGSGRQSPAQMMCSPAMYRTYDSSIHMEQISHIKTQTRVRDDSPSMCLKEEASKPVEAAEEENLPEDETIAATDSKHFPSDKESVKGIDLDNIPTSKRVEEVSHKEATEKPEDQPGYEEVGEETGHFEMTQMQHLITGRMYMDLADNPQHK